MGACSWRTWLVTCLVAALAGVGLAVVRVSLGAAEAYGTTGATVTEDAQLPPAQERRPSATPVASTSSPAATHRARVVEAPKAAGSVPRKSAAQKAPKDGRKGSAGKGGRRHR